MRSRPNSWGFFVPPLLSLFVALGVVRYQTARHEAISEELLHAKHEVARLAKMLPKGASVSVSDADGCTDEAHHHSHD